MPGLLSAREIAAELGDYNVRLSPAALAQLNCYLELLLRWNRRINLTGIREPRAILRRLFGESLYLAGVVRVRGWLVDVGSGAGFPGLALKLAAPGLKVSLIEPRRRKCAFLKEVARRCGFSSVEVVAERFESWVQSREGEEGADLITTRAVAVTPDLLRAMADLLGREGRAVFLTTGKLAEKMKAQERGWGWEPVRSVPGDGGRVVIVGCPRTT